MIDNALVIAGIFAAVVASVRWMFWREYKEKRSGKLLFLTHTTHAFWPGMLLPDGAVISRIVQVAPTALESGGRAPCFEVYGVREQND